MGYKPLFSFIGIIAHLEQDNVLESFLYTLFFVLLYILLKLVFVGIPILYHSPWLV